MAYTTENAKKSISFDLSVFVESLNTKLNSADAKS